MNRDLPPRSEAAAGADPREPFRVDHPAEIHALLKRLVDEAVPVSLAGADGGSVTCTLCTLDAAGHRIGFSAEGIGLPMQQIVEADEAVAVAHLDHVKLQFDLQDLMLVHGPQRSTLQARWPSPLYRFQRRQSYRVPTIERSAPRARFVHPGSGVTVELRVTDISDGGCALFLPDGQVAPAAGSRLEHARIELDADTRIDATLVLLHVTTIRPAARGVRLGCQLLDLHGDAPRVLQRYIAHTQKQRRLLQLD